MGLPSAINFYGFAEADACQITNHGDCGAQTNGFQPRDGIMGIFVKIGNTLQMTLDCNQGGAIFVIGIHSNGARRFEFAKAVGFRVLVWK